MADTCESVYDDDDDGSSILLDLSSLERSIENDFFSVETFSVHDGLVVFLFSFNGSTFLRSKVKIGDLGLSKQQPISLAAARAVFHFGLTLAASIWMGFMCRNIHLHLPDELFADVLQDRHTEFINYWRSFFRNSLMEFYLMNDIRWIADPEFPTIHLYRSHIDPSIPLSDQKVEQLVSCDRSISFLSYSLRSTMIRLTFLLWKREKLWSLSEEEKTLLSSGRGSESRKSIQSKPIGFIWATPLESMKKTRA